MGQKGISMFTYFVSYLWSSKAGGLVPADGMVAIHAPVADGDGLEQLREAVWQIVQLNSDYAGGAVNAGIVIVNFILLSSPAVGTVS
jgi:hypothetical protein